MNVIQRSSIPTYQQVFTFLLQIYRAKYLLQNVYLQNIHKLKGCNTRQLSYKLRARLIWFADILRSYLTDIITASTKDMTAAMTKAEDIDDISTIHLKYLARLQEQSLLAENLKPIYNSIISLLDLAVSFHDAHYQNFAAQGHDKSAPPATPKSPREIAPQRRKAQKYDACYHRPLFRFLH